MTVTMTSKRLLLHHLHQHVNEDLSESEVKGIVKETISNFCWSNSVEMRRLREVDRRDSSGGVQ